ncbi:SulP family inorganic anion transporter [Nonomuraea sp. NPDC003707]
MQAYGPAALGVIVLAAGVLHVTMGALRLGRWFRAISVAVVEGMLAGIGLVIIAGQLYAMADQPAPAGGLGKIAGLPALLGNVTGSAQALSALGVGAGTIVVMVLWQRLPAWVRVVPGALAGVLVHAGWKLLPAKHLAVLWREHRGEAVILVVTAVAIVSVNMFEVVLIGLALSVVKSAWETSHTQVKATHGDHGPIRVAISGNATFLRLPKMLDTLEALPKDRPSNWTSAGCAISTTRAVPP